MYPFVGRADSSSVWVSLTVFISTRPCSLLKLSLFRAMNPPLLGPVVTADRDFEHILIPSPTNYVARTTNEHAPFSKFRHLHKLVTLLPTLCHDQQVPNSHSTHLMAHPERLATLRLPISLASSQKTTRPSSSLPPGATDLSTPTSASSSSSGICRLNGLRREHYSSQYSTIR